MFKTENCELVDELECDILFQVKYKRKCDNCGYEDINEHKFCSVLKNGSTLDIDNWSCPHCGKLCETKIMVDNH